eukprot:gnl/TRDRNA2_/TRDRNA2_191295_c0_seq1.p1 gnl/TRDRNA2_/TRDRNA2_191295_c0~~gnl/TRDRNA2_/TRDRNA2_191295_c0_seq1.p1  ORF type:complete len:359 (-),score=78.07 gnl/TRDRNA2_/TRDRNA2_191295_c0_seq1:59-1111(-)
MGGTLLTSLLLHALVGRVASLRLDVRQKRSVNTGTQQEKVRALGRDEQQVELGSVRMGIRRADLPSDLQELGLQIFGGSSQELKEFLDVTTVPMEVRLKNGQSMLIAMFGVNKTGLQAAVQDVAADPYHILEMNTLPGGVMVDVGSSIGDQAVMAAKMHKDLQVIALEPVPNSYFYLRLNMHLNGVPLLRESDLGMPGKGGVLPLNSALSSDGRDVEVRWTDGASRFGVTVDGSNGFDGDWSRKKTHSVQLDKYLDEHGVNQIQLLKMDCEGCEYEVLPSLKQFLCKGRVRRIEGEMHQWAYDHPQHVQDLMRESVATPKQIGDAVEALTSCGCDSVTDRWVACHPGKVT